MADIPGRMANMSLQDRRRQEADRKFYLREFIRSNFVHQVEQYQIWKTQFSDDVKEFPIEAACFLYYQMLAMDTLHGDRFKPKKGFKDERSGKTYYLRRVVSTDERVIYLDECSCGVRNVGQTGTSYDGRYSSAPNKVKEHVEQKMKEGDLNHKKKDTVILQKIAEEELFTRPEFQTYFEESDNRVELRHIEALWIKELTEKERDLDVHRNAFIQNTDRKKMQRLLDKMIKFEKTSKVPIEDFVRPA